MILAGIILFGDELKRAAIRAAVLKRQRGRVLRPYVLRLVVGQHRHCMNAGKDGVGG